MPALDILGKLSGVNLTQLQRILIITDGTLSEILEAAFLERIRLVKLSQNVVSFEEPHRHLNSEPQEPFLERKILLQGMKSGRNYVYAESLIATKRLPSRFDDELVSSDTPLGQLWLEHRLETFKELLEVQCEAAGARHEHFQCQPSAMLVARAYRVSSAAQPVMTIRECFPVDWPAHEI